MGTEAEVLKQVVQSYRGGRLEVRDVPAPVAQPGTLLVRTRASLISSGTERATLDMAQKSLMGKAQARPDLVRKVAGHVAKEGLGESLRLVQGRLNAQAALGYSAAGSVIAVGAGVRGWHIGDRVACAGQDHASHAEQLCVPANLCTPIPDGVSDLQAAFVAVGAIALQSLRQAQPALGETVAVVGLGLVGQLVARLALANGCRVVATDPAGVRCDLLKNAIDQLGPVSTGLVAVSSGAKQHVDSLTSGQGADHTVVAASSRDNAPLLSGINMLRKRGKLIVLGDVELRLPREELYRKEIELCLSTSYGPGRYDHDYEINGLDYPYAYVRWTEQRNMAAFLQLLAQGALVVDDLVSARFSLAEAPSAYAELMNAGPETLGIALVYDAEEDDLTPSSAAMVMRPRNSARPLRLQLGVIGAGNHFRDRLLPAFQREGRIDIVNVCSRSGVKSRGLADDVASPRCTTSPAELLADLDVQGVIIATQHDSHAGLIDQALRAGKHVFCEKPMCLTLPELLRLRETYADLQAQDREPLQLMLGFNRRHSSHTEFLTDVFAGASQPLMMQYRVNAGALPADHWTQDPTRGGGRILGEACHFVDLMGALTRSYPISVFAQAIAADDPQRASDQCLVHLQYADGSLGTLLYSGAGDPRSGKERLEVYADGISATLEDYRLTRVYGSGRRRSHRTRTPDRGFDKQAGAFADCVSSPSADHQQFHADCATMLALLLAVESCHTGRRYDVRF